MSGTPHYPVMLPQVLEAACVVPGDHWIDGTFGAGGYTRALANLGARVTAYDRDPAAAGFFNAVRDEAEGRVALRQACFSAMSLDHPAGTIQGVVLDLGVSSMQLDQAERGFSFMRDGPLDMRMSASGRTAADIVNEAEGPELARILFVYGEERQSRRIAQFILRRRSEARFERTLDLAEVVERALGGRRGARVHPATRTFQALRIAVNAELDELEYGLKASEAVLAEGGRLIVVTFHSLEDRIVKSFLADRSGKRGGVSRHQPEPEAGAAPSFRLVGKGMVLPSDLETAENPRSRSAKLRAAVRTDAPVWEEL